jgi:cytochrome oxidase Cu insertion factor (SCO1/SenC/PrrC family)
MDLATPSSNHVSEPAADSAGTATSAVGPGESDAPISTSGTSARRAAFARGAPGIPRKFVVWVIALVVVLAVGGAVLERALSAAGLNPGGASSPPATAGAPAAYPPPLSGRPVSGEAGAPAFAGVSKPVAAGLSAVMGLGTLTPSVAPKVSLTGPVGPVDLASLRGRVVVISFFDSACDDICHVLGSEIAAADSALGPEASRVMFLTVNTDPLAPGSAALSRKVFGSEEVPSNWVFASGTLSALDRVWTSYHITVDVARPAGAVSHNDLLYFVDPAGMLRYEASPYADEDLSGRWTLPVTVVSQWGEGIAAIAKDLSR